MFRNYPVHCIAAGLVGATAAACLGLTGTVPAAAAITGAVASTGLIGGGVISILEDLGQGW